MSDSNDSQPETPPEDAEVPPTTESGTSEVTDEEGCWAWAPAFIAMGTLTMIIGFIFCAGSTYYLFQQRGELALRTLSGTLVPLIEQTSMEPNDKKAVVQTINEFVEEGKAGTYEDFQIAGATQRLIRIPLLSWGDLQAMHDTVAKRESLQNRDELLRDISRLMRGIELDKITKFEMPHVFEPVSTEANIETGYTLNFDLSDESIQEFGKRVKATADRAEVPNREFNVSIRDIVRRQIDAGIESGMK